MAYCRRLCTATLMLSIIVTGYIDGASSLDVVALVNSSAAISCNSSTTDSSDIQWHFNSFYTYVYAGGNFKVPFRGRFRLEWDNDTASFILIIPNVKLEDAGVYYCSEWKSDRQTSTTHLTVLGSNPICHSNMNPDGFVGPNTCDRPPEDMIFTCAVYFNGKAPRLIWRSLNGSQPLNKSVCNKTDNSISCSLTLRSNPVFDGSSFVCKIASENETKYNCSTSAIKVQYFSTVYDDRPTYKKINERVNCTVNSNINIRYNWTLKKDGSDLFLSNNRTIIVDTSGTYQCEVEYSIRNFSCSYLVSVVNFSSPITTESPEGQRNLSIIILLIALLFVILLVLVIGVLLYCGGKKRKKINRSESLKLVTERQKRLKDIHPRLIEACTMLRVGDELLQKLNEASLDETETEADDENLPDIKVHNFDKSYRSFRKDLEKVNPLLGKYLFEGEIIFVDVQAMIPALRASLSKHFNEAVSIKLSEDGISVLGSSFSNGLKVLLYCRGKEHMDSFIKLFQSGKLERMLSDVLKKLLLANEPDENASFQVVVSVNQMEDSAINSFTGREDWCIIDLDNLESIEEWPLDDDEGRKLHSTESGCDEYKEIGKISLKQSKLIQRERVTGMTIVENQLFVIYTGSSIIEIYCCQTYRYQNYKEVKKMTNPEDIASCALNKRLYILHKPSKVEIMQIELSNFKVTTKWHVQGVSGRMSTTKSGSIVLSLLGKGKQEIIEFHPDKRPLIRRFSLNDQVSRSLAMQVLKMNSDQFICMEEYKARLLTVDDKGVLQKTTQIEGSKGVLANIFHIIKDRKGNYIVADSDHYRILIFDSSLNNQRQLKIYYLERADDIAFDEPCERLFVLNQDAQSVQVLKIKQREGNHTTENGISSSV